MKNVAIIGRGVQSKFYHYKILKSFKNIKLFYYKDYKIKKFLDLLKFLKKNKIKYIIISEPTNFHYPLLKKLVNGQFNILCEKPFCHSYTAAKKILEKSNKYNKNFYINYQYRFEPGIVLLKNLIKKNKLGEIFSVKIDWITSGWNNIKRYSRFKFLKNFGGIKKEYCSHIFDYLIWLFNNDIKPLKYYYKTNIPFRVVKNKYVKIHVEDYVEILLKNKKKILFEIKVTNVNKKDAGHRILVCGSKGNFLIEHKKPYLYSNYSIKYNSEKKKYKKKYVSNIDTRYVATKKLIKLFLSKKNVISPTFSDGLNVHKILHLLEKKKVRKSFII